MSSRGSLRAARGALVAGAGTLSVMAESFASLERVARECSVEDLPELAGQVAGWAARVDRLISFRIAVAGRSAAADAALEPLLTVPEVAKLLRISEGEVYRRAKTDLKPSTTELGPGSLRWSPERLRQFIDARTGR